MSDNEGTLWSEGEGAQDSRNGAGELPPSWKGHTHDQLIRAGRLFLRLSPKERKAALQGLPENFQRVLKEWLEQNE